jgi:hypothetical protein
MNITNILYWFPLVWWLIHWDVLHTHSSQGHTSWGHYHWHNRLWQRSAGLHPTGLWTASLQWVWLSKLRVSESSCTHNCMKCVGYHPMCVLHVSPLSNTTVRALHYGLKFMTQGMTCQRLLRIHQMIFSLFKITGREMFGECSARCHVEM